MEPVQKFQTAVPDLLEEICFSTSFLSCALTLTSVRMRKNGLAVMLDGWGCKAQKAGVRCTPLSSFCSSSSSSSLRVAPAGHARREIGGRAAFVQHGACGRSHNFAQTLIAKTWLTKTFGYDTVHAILISVMPRPP